MFLIMILKWLMSSSDACYKHLADAEITRSLTTQWTALLVRQPALHAPLPDFLHAVDICADVAKNP